MEVKRMKIYNVSKNEYESKKLTLDLGITRTFNHFYIIEINENKLCIGLKTSTNDLLPQIKMFDEELILINGLDAFYVINNNGVILLKILSEIIFYEFVISKNHVLIFGETELLLINKEIRLVWHRKLEDILVNYKIKNNIVEVSCSDMKSMQIEFFTGRLLK